MLWFVLLSVFLFSPGGALGNGVFQPGRQYSFAYQSQTSSGMALTHQGNLSSQRSIVGFKTVVQLQFLQEQRAILRLSQPEFGQLQQEVEEHQNLQPWSLFQAKTLPEAKEQMLARPVRFRYSNGRIDELQFDSSEKVWSKNLKKAVLNTLQLNRESQKGSSYTVQEVTLEGDCLVSYSLNDKKEVQKHIHFKHCEEARDLSFGFPSPRQAHRCAQCSKKEEEGSAETCPKWCQTQKLEDDVLERSTEMRFTLKDQGIERVQVESVYRFVSPESSYLNEKRKKDAFMGILQTNVISELVFKEESEQRTDSWTSGEGTVQQQPETLLYDNSMCLSEKRFYMHGDEGSSPFHKSEEKLKEQISQRVKDILRETAFEQSKGIPSGAAQYFQQLVELVRKCSVKELQKAYEEFVSTSSSSSSIEEPAEESLTNTPAISQPNSKARAILDDSLAAAGTRNALAVLSTRIQRKEVSTSKAILALKAISAAMHSPSDEQVKLLLNLCQSRTVTEELELKQSCLLTVGALIGELCQGRPAAIRKRLGNHNDKMCSATKRKQYAEALIRHFDQAESSTIKIIALKAIGNAGLDTTLQELKQIILAGEESSKESGEAVQLVRITAIDALRRLRAKGMSKQVEEILLPIFLNTEERSEVRMAAFYQLMGCSSIQESTIDQIAFALKKELNSPVYAFVYSVWKTIAISKGTSQLKTVQHVQKALSELPVVPSPCKRHFAAFTSDPDYQSSPMSIAYSNFFSDHAKLMATVSSVTIGKLPVLYSSPEDFSFAPKGHSIPETLEFTTMQSNVEQWYEQLIVGLSSSFFNGTQSDGQWSQSSSKAVGDIRKNWQFSKRHSPKGISPVVVCSLRIDDVDHFAFAFEESTRNAMRQSLRTGSKWDSAMTIGDKAAHAPTSSGLMLKFGHSLPFVVSLRQKISSTRAPESPASAIYPPSSVQVHFQPSAAASHIHYMEVWSPLNTIGVENIQSVEVNIPINLQLDNASKKDGPSDISIIFRAPTASIKVFSIHTLPAVYTKDFDHKTHTNEEIRILPIQGAQLTGLVDVDEVLGEDEYSRLLLKGQAHLPALRPNGGRLARLEQLKGLVDLLPLTENHLDFYIEMKEPVDQNRRVQWRFVIGSKFFQKKTGEELQQFLSGLDTFYNDWAQMQTEQERTGHNFQVELNDKIRQIKEQDQIFSHSANFKFQIREGNKDWAELFGSLKLKAKADCDSKFRYCSIGLEHQDKVEAPGAGFKQVRTINLQVIGPDMSHSIEEFELAQQNNDKFLAYVADINIHTTKLLHNKMMEQNKDKLVHFRLRMESNWPESKSTLPLLDKLSYKFELHKDTVNMLSEVLRNNPNVRFIDLSKPKTKDLFMEMIGLIEPNGESITLLQVDSSFNTSSRIPITYPVSPPFPLMPLVQPKKSGPQFSTPNNGVHGFLKREVNRVRQECHLNTHQVRTFDGVYYNAPLSNKCYSIVAKDCSVDQPEFIVLVKRVESHTIKVKVITPQETIEVNPATGDSPLAVRVNHKPLTQSTESIQLHKNNGFEMHNDHLNIRITEGGELWLSLANVYKYKQCGLCGHYDDNVEDEFQGASQDLSSSDLKAFHRSYSLLGRECTEETMDDFYQQGTFSRAQPDWQQKNSLEHSMGRRLDRKNNPISPIESTKVLEFKNKVCFSVEPLKQCPKGSVPTQNDEEVKKSFACIPRFHQDQSRMIKAARKGQEEQEWLAEKIAEISNQQEMIVVLPRQCQSIDY